MAMSDHFHMTLMRQRANIPALRMLGTNLGKLKAMCNHHDDFCSWWSCIKHVVLSTSILTRCFGHVFTPLKALTRSSNAFLGGSQVEASNIRVGDRAPACPMQLVPGRCQKAPQHVHIITFAHKRLQAAL